MSPLSGVLSEAWALYRRHASHFIAISFVIYLVIAVITALLYLVARLVGALHRADLSACSARSCCRRRW